MSDLTHDDRAKLERYGVALYEARLCQLGPKISDDDDSRTSRLWASSALGECMCVLELQFGIESADEMARAMLDRRLEYTGPRTKRMRS